MTAIQTLEHEHEVILLVLGAVEREAAAIRATGRVRRERVEKMLDFIRNFADRCHHAKEEKHLFARMEQRGLPREGGPIGVMIHEHEQGRSHVRAAVEALPRAAAGDRGAASSLADSLAAYARLLRAHIDKENNVLYPIALQILTPDDRRSLAEAFEKVEAEEMGADVHETYHRLAHELAEG